jgi:hypothetical protein
LISSYFPLLSCISLGIFLLYSDHWMAPPCFWTLALNLFAPTLTSFLLQLLLAALCRCCTQDCWKLPSTLHRLVYDIISQNQSLMPLWFGMYRKCLLELMWVLWGFPQTIFTSLCIYEEHWNCSQVSKKEVVIHMVFIEYVFYAVQVVVGVWCLLMLVWTYLLVIEFLTAVKSFVVKWICKLALVSLVIILSII